MPELENIILNLELKTKSDAIEFLKQCQEKGLRFDLKLNTPKDLKTDVFKTANRKVSELESNLNKSFVAVSSGLRKIGGTAGEVGAMIPRLLVNPLTFGITTAVAAFGGLFVKSQQTEKLFFSLGRTIQKSFAISSNVARNLAHDVAGLGVAIGEGAEKANEFYLKLSKTNFSSSLNDTKTLFKEISVAIDGSSVNFENLVEIFEQISSSGKVTSSELRSLTNILGEDFLKALTDVKGQDPFQNLNKIRVDDIRNAVKSISGETGTLNERFEELSRKGENSAVRIANAFADLAIELSKQSGITGAVTKLFNAIADGVDAFSKKISKASRENFISSNFENYLKSLEAFRAGLGKDNSDLEKLFNERKNLERRASEISVELGNFHWSGTEDLEKEQEEVLKKIEEFKKKISEETTFKVGKSSFDFDKSFFENGGDLQKILSEWNSSNEDQNKIKVGVNSDDLKSKFQELSDKLNTDLFHFSFSGDGLVKEMGLPELETSLDNLKVKFSDIKLGDDASVADLEKSKQILVEMRKEYEKQAKALLDSGDKTKNLQTLQKDINALKKEEESIEGRISTEKQKQFDTANKILAGISGGANAFDNFGGSIKNFIDGDIAEGFKGIGKGIESVGDAIPNELGGGIIKGIGQGIEAVTGMVDNFVKWLDSDRIKRIQDQLAEDLKSLDKRYQEHQKAIDASIKGFEALNTKLDEELSVLDDAFNRGAISAEAQNEEREKIINQKTENDKKIEEQKKEKELAEKRKKLEEELLKQRAKAEIERNWFGGQNSAGKAASERARQIEAEINNLERESRNKKSFIPQSSGIVPQSFSGFGSVFPKFESSGLQAFSSGLREASANNTSNTNFGGVQIQIIGENKNPRQLAEEMMKEIGKLTREKGRGVRV